MKPVNVSFAIIFALLMLTSCAEKNLFVLLPGADGKSGAIVVSNKGGEQVLTEPKQATAISAAGEAPTVPFSMSDEKIQERFGGTLTSLPAPPVHFLLYFNSGTTALTDESKKILDDVIAAALSRRSTDISIVGHTDRVGSREANYRLGQERIGLVREMLVSHGIRGEFIDVFSHGEDNPLVNTDDNVAEPRNRRVEVVVR